MTETVTNPAIRTALSSALAGIHFTPIEKAILYVLADGEAHPVYVVMKCLGDAFSDRNALQAHISRIRKKVERFNHDIVCTWQNRRSNYRYMISLSSLVSSDS